MPKVLLVDEPTSAIAPISTSRIEELALELKKDYTIIMVTHNMQQTSQSWLNFPSQVSMLWQKRRDDFDNI